MIKASALKASAKTVLVLFPVCDFKFLFVTSSSQPGRSRAVLASKAEPFFFVPYSDMGFLNFFLTSSFKTLDTVTFPFGFKLDLVVSSFN